MLRLAIFEVVNENPLEPQTKTFTDLWSDIFKLYSFVNSGNAVTLSDKQVLSKDTCEDIYYKFADKWIERYVEFHSACIYSHILLAHGLDYFFRFGPLSNQGFEAANKRDITFYLQKTAGLWLNLLRMVGWLLIVIKEELYNYNQFKK